MLIFAFNMQLISAESGKITLLAVSGEGDNLQGNTVELSLEVKPGNGDIYIDSFPLTKLDTQITIRFAQEIACDFLDKDCANYDFFYKLRSDATLFGGPSAGAATTVLTIAVLDHQKLDDKTVMTGTINPGGLIGPVGGVYEKALAAQKEGFEKILIPRWDYSEKSPQLLLIQINESNSRNNTEDESINKSNSQITDNVSKINESESEKTINIIKSIVEYTNSTLNNISTSINNSKNDSSVEEKLGTLNIQIKKVINLDEAMYEFTGKNYSSVYSDINIDQTYLSTMKQVSDELCNRYINTGFDYNKSIELRNDSLRKDAEEYFKLAENAGKIGRYYSRASFCFAANIRIQQLILREKNNFELKIILSNLTRQLQATNKILSNMNLQTVGDIETYMIVKERMIESEKLISQMDPKNISSENLAYALERYYSAVYWSEFFNKNAVIVEINMDLLKEVCLKKISEAEERINFVELYITPLRLNKQRADMLEVTNEYNNHNFAMCIFKASKVKAEADVISTSLYVGDDPNDNLLNEKLDQIKKNILRQQQKNKFPILGYSYYEYSLSLLDSDPQSAMIYSEYALELSNIEMYFPTKKKVFNFPDITYFIILGFGFLLGILSVLLFISLHKKPKRRKK